MKEAMTKEPTTLSADLAAKYLTVYVGNTDWLGHITRLWATLNKKSSEAEAKTQMRKILACAILLPAYDRTKIPEVPENLLFWCSTYAQFNERDWPALLDAVMKKDNEIEEYRNHALSLGVIYPIEYSPMTRQAFNWLYKAAEDANVITDENKEDIKKRFTNLVLAYGGAVICNVFMNHRDRVRKILNWRTGYFFERLIHDVYTPEQVLKIKQNELKKTNPKLVKKIRGN